jgi:predicted acetyltransferase
MNIRELLPGDERSAVEAHDELARENFEFLLGYRRGEPWRDYLDRLERERAGVDLLPGRVPASFLVGDVGGSIVGRISIRHRLNDNLAVVGGHLGYAVIPAYRGRGYATALMAGGLEVLASLGVEEALVTCSSTNAASAVVIERHGGVLIDVVTPDGDSGPAWRRYRVGTGRPDRVESPAT